MHQENNYGLDTLANLLHETAIEKGFWDGEYNHDKVGNKLALVHSEVTEVLEAIRKSHGRRRGVRSSEFVFMRVHGSWSSSSGS